MSDPSTDPTVSFDSESAEDIRPETVAAMFAPAELKVSVGSLLLNRFKLIAHAGDGGMSHVYKAIDLRKVEARLNDPYVAVKLLTGPTQDHSRVLAQLQAEAQKLQSLTHPNIVRVFDCDRDGPTVFMTMEYLSGEPLKNKLAAPGFNGLPAGEAMRIVEYIASALILAHRIGIVHGDLKPGNIMITDAGEVKVIDFGIARAMTRPRRETPGMTASYASPQMLERQEPDPRDDIYALGCIAYEMLTGRHPFDRADAVTARASGLGVKRPVAMSPRQFKAIAHALQFERESRTPSVARFLEELHGAPNAALRWLIPVAAVALVALAIGAYRLVSTRPVPVAPPVAKPETAAPVTSLTPGKVFRDCPTCPLMMVIPAGRFEQGADESDLQATDLERPRHAVTIGFPVAIAVNETTRGEIKEFVAATGREMRGCMSYDGAWKMQPTLSWSEISADQTALHPAGCLSWNDAQAYAKWLSDKTGHHYRLPSASEWEYAAGAVAEDICTQANVADATAAVRYPGWKVQSCSDGFVDAAPVGSFAANTFGLHDVMGNVFEWTQDCWRDTYADAPTDGAPQRSGNCMEREMRGGSWFTAPSHLRRSYRNHFGADYRSTTVGLRIVRDVSP